MADMSEITITQPSVKRLERSSDRILAGVAGGLGKYFDVSPAVFRLGFVVLTVIGGAGILVFIAAALLIPAAHKEKAIAQGGLAPGREHPGPPVALRLIPGVVLP